MKKSIIVILAFIAVTQSHAASVVWGFEEQGRGYFGTAHVGSTAIGYLVYLGENGTWANVDIATLISGTSSSIVDSTTSTSGRLPGATDSLTLTDWVNNKSTYGFIVIKTGQPSDATEASTYYILSDVFLVSTSSSFYDSIMETYSWELSVSAAPNNTTASITGQGWVKVIPVPEPATGAMALAGLALLFRRKRK